jgi:hypothetical protein
MLRCAITALDTMPSVILRNEDAVVWEKLDVAYERILQPLFAAVLDKHHMRTRLDFIFKTPQQFTSTVFQKGEVSCSATVDQEPQYEFWLNGESTNIGVALQKLSKYRIVECLKETLTKPVVFIIVLTCGNLKKVSRTARI